MKSYFGRWHRDKSGCLWDISSDDVYTITEKGQEELDDSGLIEQLANVLDPFNRTFILNDGDSDDDRDDDPSGDGSNPNQTPLTWLDDPNDYTYATTDDLDHCYMNNHMGEVLLEIAHGKLTRTVLQKKDELDRLRILTEVQERARLDLATVKEDISVDEMQEKLNENIRMAKEKAEDSVPNADAIKNLERKIVSLNQLARHCYNDILLLRKDASQVLA